MAETYSRDLRVHSNLQYISGSVVAGLGEEDVACSLGDGSVAEFAGGHPLAVAPAPLGSASMHC